MRGIGLLAALLVVGSTSAVGAAVRKCDVPIVVPAIEAPSELAAKKKALDQWLAEARKIGPGYTRWQIANNRKLECTKTTTGAHRCQATGAPCTIEQAPRKG
jgi:hypothetical protein